MALVSILTPAYKAEKMIARAVRSVLAQTYADWEMLIVSDDSQDYQAILAAEGFTDARLRFASTGAVGSGPSRGRNIGLAMSKGEYITTLDADDEYHPLYLATMLEAARTHGVAMVLLANKLKEDGEKKAISYHQEINPKAEFSLLTLEDYIKINGCTVSLFRKDLSSHRYFEDISHAEDFFFDVRFYQWVNVIPVIHEKYYIYHDNAGSLTNKVRSDDKFIDDYKKVIERLESDDSLPAHLKNMFLALYHHRLFQNYLYLNAKAKGQCADFFEFMAKFPQYFS